MGLGNTCSNGLDVMFTVRRLGVSDRIAALIEGRSP